MVDLSAQQMLVLASASSGRRELLENIGLIPDAIIPSDIDEARLEGEKPRDFVHRLACEKAGAVKKTQTDSYIIAADTVGAAGNRMLLKPADEKEAEEMLRLMSGRRHKVHSGVCVIAPDGKQASRAVSTIVKFKRLEDDEIARYLQSGEWKGKSGGYGIQSHAGGFIEFINGSFSNVVGLPLVETRRLLKGLGFDEGLHQAKYKK